MTKKSDNGSLLFPTARIGTCRICSKKTKLSREHIIPGKAGGGSKIKLYSPIDILQNEDDLSRIHGAIMQSGLSGYTLCEKCNNSSGHFYDDVFSDFLNDLNGCLHVFIEEKGINYERMKKSQFVITYKTPRKIKPLNIAKRVLVSFCSNETQNIAEDFPEIRKAIMNHNYKPDTKGFRIFFSALTGGTNSFFSKIATIHRELGVLVFSGIEYGHTGFYFTAEDNEMPSDMLDITNWLTNYDYNQEADACFEMVLVCTHGLVTPPIK